MSLYFPCLYFSASKFLKYLSSELVGLISYLTHLYKFCDTDCLITPFTVVLNIFYCLWWTGWYFITFPYSISVSKPIIECYKQLSSPKHRLGYKILYLTCFLSLQGILELVSKMRLPSHDLAEAQKIPAIF